MSASTFRSILSAVRGHKVEPATDVLYYDASDLWHCFYSDNPSCHRRRELPAPVRLHHKHMPEKRLPEGLSPDKYRVVRVVVISDTHEYHSLLAIPPADLLLHCGDILQADSLTVLERFSLARFKAFLEWLQVQPCRHKVIVGGNHDLLLDSTPLEAVRQLVQECSGAIYLEDEVLRFRKDLTVAVRKEKVRTNAAQKTTRRDSESSLDVPDDVSTQPLPPSTERDCCAGLTIFGTPRSVPNGRSSPNKAFQNILIWHRAAYVLSLRELKAYRTVVLRRLRDSIQLESADGSLVMAHLPPPSASKVSDESSDKKERGVGKDHDKKEDRHKTHRYPSFTAAEGQPKLINAPSPMVAQIRFQLQDEAYGGLRGGFEDSPDNDSKSNASVVTTALKGSPHNLKALEAVRKYNAIKGPVHSTTACEVFSIRAYQQLWNTNTTSGANTSMNPPTPPQIHSPLETGVRTLSYVQPLKGIDIAMTHMSLGGALQELVETFLQPRLMHVGGHVHECKGIHSLYRVPNGNAEPRMVPSVGGAMTGGSFSKERIKPAAVLDLVVPWDS